jgi:hypothetical protein
MLHRIRQVKGPWLLASAIAIALIVSPFAVAAGEGSPILGGKRSPSSNQSQAFTRETEIIANTNTYGTRQSNKSDNGGGAIYGCRSKPGGTEKGFNPCVRANNLAGGRAFEFETNGAEAGRFINQNVNGAPFTTNAKGVATGLNADQVDGKNADEIAKDAQASAQNLTKFAAVAGNGTLGGNRGASAAARTSAGNYTVTFADDISACAIQATETTLDAGSIGVQLGADKKTVSVRTRAPGDATTPQGTVADSPFHLTVSC